MKTFSQDEIVPMEFWGKDHWSTLAYVETVMVEHAGFQIGSDARMKSNRRNFRVMREQCPRPKRTNHAFGGIVMNPEHSSVLRNAASVNHDDWCCVQDMAAAGLFIESDCQPGVVLRLSEYGAHVVNALREHKRVGGSYTTFKCPELVGAA